MTHPTTRIDDVVHQRARLGILALLAPAKEVEFNHVRDSLELTDGNLSRHIQVLETAGFLKIRKGFSGKRPRTWVSITSDGRNALEAEISALREIVVGFGDGKKRR